MKPLKIGDRVKSIKDLCPDGLPRLNPRYVGEKGVVVGTGIGSTENYIYSYRIKLENGVRVNFMRKELIKLNKKGIIMSLLKKLLKPDDALIEKHAMDGGDLDFDNELVQLALLKTDGFKQNLIELCREREKECNSKKK